MKQLPSHIHPIKVLVENHTTERRRVHLFSRDNQHNIDITFKLRHQVEELNDYSYQDLMKDLADGASLFVNHIYLRTIAGQQIDSLPYNYYYHNKYVHAASSFEKSALQQQMNIIEHIPDFRMDIWRDCMLEFNMPAHTTAEFSFSNRNKV